MLNDIKVYADLLEQRYDQMKRAEAAYESAKKAYEDYAVHTIPDVFRGAGLTSLELADGRSITITPKTVCSITKAYKEQIAQWLEKQQAAYLVRTKCIADEKVLKEHNIDYQKEVDMNTQSVKSWVIGALGQKGSPATIQAQDLPTGLNFYQFEVAEVKE